MTRSKPKIEPMVGPNLRLREVEVDDAATIIRWRNDPALGRYLSGDTLTVEDQLAFMEGYAQRDNDFYFFGETKESGHPVGAIALYGYHPLAGVAEWGRLVVDPGHRLLGFEMCFLSLQFGFEVLGLQKVSAGVQKANTAAYKFDTLVGFIEEGTLRKQYWNGEYADDVILLAMFDEQYQDLKRRYQRLFDRG